MKQVISSNEYGRTEKENKIMRIQSEFKELERQYKEYFVELNIKLIDNSLRGNQKLLNFN